MKRPRSKKGAPGIIEVAQRAGVSPATVSRFFNAPDIVRTTTRRKIEQAAADLGYIRDRLAGSLHTKFSGTIGLIVPTIDNAIFSELIQAFAAQLRQHDRTMLIAAHGYDLNLEVAIVRSLLERRIDGVAIIGLDHESAPLEMLASRKVPVLAAWNYRTDSNVPCIGADNFDAGAQVTRYLVERGHEDIALLFPPTQSNDRAYDRLQGALSVLDKSLENLKPQHFIEINYDIGQAKQAVTHLLQSNRPTALICGNDVIAQGAVYACQTLNLRVPDDISVIGIGDFGGSAHMEPALTTLRLPARRIGEAAADMLCSGAGLVKNGQPKRVVIPSTMMERSSVCEVC